jgi:hypothetical protein
MLAGEMDPGDFSDKLNRERGPPIRQGHAEAKAMAAENGRLESFKLIARATPSQGKELQYRAFSEYQMRCRVYVSLDSAGKITDCGVRSADRSTTSRWKTKKLGTVQFTNSCLEGFCC